MSESKREVIATFTDVKSTQIPSRASNSKSQTSDNELWGKYKIVSIDSITIYTPSKEEKERDKAMSKADEKKWYTIKPIFENVDKSTFKSFISNYPRKLECDVCGISDPPSITYNDFELANRWPYSVVANTFGYDDDPKGYFYEPEDKRTYRIMVNHEEVFNSRTGYKE